MLPTARLKKEIPHSKQARLSVGNTEVLETEVREEKQAKGAAIIGLACSCDHENGEDHQDHQISNGSTTTIKRASV